MTLLEVVQNLKKHKVPCSIDVIKNELFDGAAFSIQVPYGSIVEAIEKLSAVYHFMPCGPEHTILVVMSPCTKYEPKIIGTCNSDIIDTVARAYNDQTNSCY